MSVSKAKANKLRECWYGPMSAEEIAKWFRFASGQVVRNFWQREKSAGRLPLDCDRPHFAGANIPDDLDENGQDEEGRAMRIPDNDPALAAMRQHHAALDNDTAQTAPPAWLRHDARGVAPPTAAQLVAMQRQFDQQTKDRSK